jgi:hypothetical protein
MNIGETKKTGVAEPVSDPIPQKIEQPAPAEQPQAPETVPA